MGDSYTKAEFKEIPVGTNDASPWFPHDRERVPSAHRQRPAR
jgi:hypothetical protein